MRVLPSWLSTLVGLPEVGRSKTIIVAMQAYIDDGGGKGQGPTFVLSGLLARVEFWIPIVEAWNACLREAPSIRYFKMSEAVAGNGEFRFFSDDDRNEKLRKLCRVVNKTDLTEFTCVVMMKDFCGEWIPRHGPPMNQPYFMAFQIINTIVGLEMLRLKETHPPEVFFDEQLIFGPRAKAWYPIVRANASAEVRPLMPVEPLFRSDEAIIPLQAADLTAWMRRMANGAGLGEFSWLESELSSIQHSPYSGRFNSEWMRKAKESPEDAGLRESVLRSYRETFGFDWPPQTKPQARIHRGRTKGHTEFERMDAMTRGLLSVPHQEIKEKLDREKSARKRKKSRKT